MAFTVGATAAKDGAASPAAIPGGLLSADVAGGGVGPTFFFHGLVDGVAGVNKANITAGNALKVDGSAVTQPVSLVTAPALVASAAVIGKVGIDQTTDLTTNKVRAFIHDGTTALTVLAASSGAPAASVAALPVSIRDVNPNLADGSGQSSTSGHFGAPVVGIDPYSQYETVVASATDQVMGASGAQYDYIAGVLIIPATSAAGAVSIKDGNGSAISVFAGGGTTALADLKPFLVPLGLHALAGTTPGWKITTGTNVSAIGIGKFT
jgi:hypothetical protein